jgi:hypothetical protein
VSFCLSHVFFFLISKMASVYSKYSKKLNLVIKCELLTTWSTQNSQPTEKTSKTGSIANEFLRMLKTLIKELNSINMELREFLLYASRQRTRKPSTYAIVFWVMWKGITCFLNVNVQCWFMAFHKFTDFYGVLNLNM